jgi:hypothetical protein
VAVPAALQRPPSGIPKKCDVAAEEQWKAIQKQATRAKKVRALTSHGLWHSTSPASTCISLRDSKVVDSNVNSVSSWDGCSLDVPPVLSAVIMLDVVGGAVSFGDVLNGKNLRRPHGSGLGRAFSGALRLS